MPTTNLAIVYLSPGQLSKEVSVNAGFDVCDNALFVRTGTLAARPTTLPAGALYWATDIGNEGLYRTSGGNVWISLLSGGTHHNFSGGTAPSAAAGSSAGTSPPAPVVVAGSNDTRGIVTFGTGTSPSAGAMAVVTFAAAYASAPYIHLNANNGQTYNSGLFISAVAATSFTIGFAGIPAASQSNTNFSATYSVRG